MTVDAEPVGDEPVLQCTGVDHHEIEAAGLRHVERGAGAGALVADVDAGPLEKCAHGVRRREREDRCTCQPESPHGRVRPPSAGCG